MKRRWFFFLAAASFVVAVAILSTEMVELMNGEPERVGIYDREIFEFLLGVRSDALTPFFRFVTSLGSFEVLSAGYAVGISVCLYSRRWKTAAYILLVSSGGALCSMFLKDFLGRPRPEQIHWLTSASGLSYPSGHSVGATSVCFAIWYAARTIASKGVRNLIVQISVVFVFLVVLSRLYLGVHFFSDTIAGVLIGCGWGLFLLGLFDQPAMKRGTE